MKIRLLTLMMFFAVYANAQNPKEISIGIGPSFFGWGDVSAAALTATYSYQFSRHLAVEPRLISSSGWRQSSNSFNSGEHFTQSSHYGLTGYLAGAASLVYTPFAGWADFLNLKSGLLLGTMAHSYGNQQTGAYPSSHSDFGKELNFGLIHTIDFRLLDREKFFVGTEVSMLTSFSDGYYNCDGFVWNFMAGIKIE